LDNRLEFKRWHSTCVIRLKLCILLNNTELHLKSIINIANDEKSSNFAIEEISY